MTISPLRSALRARLTQAVRERDRHAASALRSALAALENAEAVPADAGPAPTTSSRIAGAVVGLGAAEADRRILAPEEEGQIVTDEVAQARDAAAHRRLAGDEAGADLGEAAADVLAAVLREVRGRRSPGSVHSTG